MRKLHQLVRAMLVVVLSASASIVFAQDEIKSMRKVGFLFQIILPILSFVMILQVDITEIVAIVYLLGLAILINGFIGMLKN